MVNIKSIFEKSSFFGLIIFFLSAFILFILSGLIIPGSLIASSAAEFSFLSPYKTPFPFLYYTLVQSAGFFLFLPAGIYFLLKKQNRAIFTFLFTFFAFIAIVNTFLVREKFGFLTNTLIFSEPKPVASNFTGILLNFALIIVSSVLFIVICFIPKKNFLLSIQIIITISLFSFGFFNIRKIHSEFAFVQSERINDSADSTIVSPFFTFSKEGKNILFIMLDRGIPGYLPYIFEEKPELLTSFTGFTFYPNCVSYGGHTLVGAPPLYGGYEYTPSEINKKNSVSIYDKHREAYLVLPRIFKTLGYTVAINDPPFDSYLQSNLGIFKDYPEIRAENISGRYSSYWLRKHPDVSGLNITQLLKNNLIRFSFFKISPLIFRMFIYDSGDWLTVKNAMKTKGSLTPVTIDDYAVLDFLPELTKFSGDDKNNFNEVYVHLPHSAAFLQAPGYIPSNNVNNFGNGPFAGEDNYHVNIASFVLLGKWFSFLKKHDVYDNTRIILVSDHGASSYSRLPNNISLPNGSSLQTFNALLMAKDFNSSGELKTDNNFMTNADAPFFAFDGLVADPVNPFTGVPLKPAKIDGAVIAAIPALNSTQHSRYQYRIGKNQWLHVKENIFDPANWERAAPE
jgi:hypothetical protein